MSKTAYDCVKIVRGNDRPTSIDLIKGMFTEFVELHGDRRYADDAAVIGGVGYLGERPVTVIGIEKGHTVKERAFRRFGAPMPEGYRKALRLMKQAEKFGRPVICFVDTSGAYCGVDAEERGQGEAVAENLVTMMGLKVPVISIIIGEGGSGGALALAVADRVWMFENAVYSVISPEGCAAILWKDAACAPEAAESLKITAKDSLKFGIIEEMISENNLGKPEFYQELKTKIESELSELSGLSVEELTQKRYIRFRSLGRFERSE